MMSLWEKWKPFLPKFSPLSVSLSLSHSFLLPIRSFRLPRRRLGGISHSEKGVCIMPCSLRRSWKAPPALTRSENPIFTAAKKNERNGKERRMEVGGERKCITVFFCTDRLRQSLLLPPLSLVSPPCFGSCCHSIQHVLKTPTPRRCRGKKKTGGRGGGSVFTNPYLTTGYTRTRSFVHLICASYFRINFVLCDRSSELQWSIL